MARTIVAAFALLLLATACSKVVVITDEAATEQARAGRATATAEPAAERSPTPEPTPEPTDEPDRPDSRIQPGVWVSVEGAGDCLTFRDRPSADESAAINYCRPDGFEGYVAAGPEENDGGRWWFIAGLGWAVDEFLAFDRVEDLSSRVVPELDGVGTIAFVGPEGDLRTMNVDGTERERVEPLVDVDDGASLRPTAGFPDRNEDGSAAIVHTSVGLSDVRRFTVFVADLFGNVIYEFADATSASWSPDGRAIAMLQDLEPGAGGVEAAPVVVDLVTGEATEVGSKQFYVEGPKWRPGSDELVYETDDGIRIVRADGSDDRSISLAGRRPSWSPDGSRLSFQTFTDDCRGYAVYNVARDEIELCAPTPPSDERRGGRGGWSEDGQTDWSPDGRYFAYHTERALQNESGVYVVDARSGEQTLLPGWEPAFTSFADDNGHVVFSTSGAGAEFIWVGDIETGEVVLLAEGSAPAFVTRR